MMKTLKVNFILAFAIILTFGLMSFKLINSNPNVQKWYEIELNGSTPLNDEIGDEISNPNEVGDCASPPTSERCAIRLEHPESFDPAELTVQQILDMLDLPENDVVLNRFYKQD